MSARSELATPGCGIILSSGRPCDEAVDPHCSLNLCSRHLVAAHDWVTRDVGVTDTLPIPCAACGSRLGVRYPSGWLCAICEWKVGDVPDGEVVTTRVDVVYYIRFGDRIKIGTSGNPRTRFTGLRYEEVLAFERGNRRLEQQRHGQFAVHRLSPRSEWFQEHEALTRHIAVLSAGVADPWEQYALWVSERLALGH